MKIKTNTEEILKAKFNGVISNFDKFIYESENIDINKISYSELQKYAEKTLTTLLTLKNSFYKDLKKLQESIEIENKDLPDFETFKKE